MLLRKKYKPSDLRSRDYELLAKACFLPEGHFLCFGMSWNKLFSLNLIGDDSQPTKLGKEIATAFLKGDDDE